VTEIQGSSQQLNARNAAVEQIHPGAQAVGLLHQIVFEQPLRTGSMIE
jgi:hypothetical protein